MRGHRFEHLFVLGGEIHPFDRLTGGKAGNALEHKRKSVADLLARRRADSEDEQVGARKGRVGFAVGQVLLNKGIEALAKSDPGSALSPRLSLA